MPTQALQEQAALAEQRKGVRIRVLPWYGRTLLQITANLTASSVRFIHCTADGRERCRHLLQQGRQEQAILQEGEVGALTVETGTLPDLREQRITFRMLNQELTEVDNPHDLPLEIEVVR